MTLTEAQLKMRLTGIGASEAAAPAGYHPFMTPWDLWSKKVLGQVDPENQAMLVGSYLEPAVARWYSDETGAVVHKCRTRRHRKHHWMLATADRQVIVDGKRGKIVEIKVPGRRGHGWGYEPDAVPPYVMFQAQQQMEVYEQDEVDVVALFLLTRELAIYHLERNQDLINAMIEINGRFWRDYVETKQPPPMDGSAAAGAWLREQFGAPDQEMVAASPDAEEWARNYASAQAMIKSAEAGKELAGNNLRLEIGDHAGIVGGWGKATWKPQRGKPQWKAIAEAYRELLVAHHFNPERLDGIIKDNTPAAVRTLRVKYNDALNDDTED